MHERSDGRSAARRESIRPRSSGRRSAPSATALSPRMNTLEPSGNRTSARAPLSVLILASASSGVPRHRALLARRRRRPDFAGSELEPRLDRRSLARRRLAREHVDDEDRRRTGRAAEPSATSRSAAGAFAGIVHHRPPSLPLFGRRYGVKRLAHSAHPEQPVAKPRLPPNEPRRRPRFGRAPSDAHAFCGVDVARNAVDQKARSRADFWFWRTCALPLRLRPALPEPRRPPAAGSEKPPCAEPSAASWRAKSASSRRRA